MNGIEPQDPHRIVALLLGWYEVARRELPWRRVREPYAVWVSETMLQQTQVATVVPYFERWMALFPDVVALAGAPLDSVLKAWEGLGYYGRARNLHRAAQEIAARHGGKLPGARAELLRLPGIGRYTAGAILSLAYAQPEPALDGNARRVLCRLFDMAGPVQSGAGAALLWEAARQLVLLAPPGESGNFNESLMELGALICRPVRPSCSSCPLDTQCLAYRNRTVAERPFRPPRAALPDRVQAVGLVRDGRGRWLIAQRPQLGLLGGLWGFPATALQSLGATEEVLRSELLDQLRLVAQPSAPVAVIRRSFTHFRLTLYVYLATLSEGEPLLANYVASSWAASEELHTFAFAAADRAIARFVTGAAPTAQQPPIASAR